MKFLLLPSLPDEHASVRRQFAHLVDEAVLAEQLGFDAFGIGERHDGRVAASSPAVILANIAAHTSTIQLVTTVSTLGLHDPLRAFEDYSTLDHLAGGRLDLVIGKGGYAETLRVFGVTDDDKWDRLRESYEVFRALWNETEVSWEGRFRPPLVNVTALPRPARPNLRIWHGANTNLESADFAARHGDPVFTSIGTAAVGRYLETVQYYRERFASYGHDPEHALVGVGTGGFFAAATSQEAVRKFTPAFERRLAYNRRYEHGALDRLGAATLEDYLTKTSALVGSPQQVIDTLLAQHEKFQHDLVHIHVDTQAISPEDYRATLEIFATEIVPVIRKEIPNKPIDDWHAPPPVARVPVPVAADRA
ncbi:LLM class flavin-dependent oxidoreductase [Frankia sp. CNm7]|uniref:LLM class flavin-dependent oxidoreductase n=1 Tax=Frankia nepalensis TaxID=1836974 RepID=A0A937UNE0_9ACTN|nr:LLM class flavin-dependent oxidoreductase [Frankia nepalensis]MBL7496922.1 LLM class flavin-dependent oxidoreductase [Frankia nepalensis]MBL7508317.1 LLM class flavin-dependent oxidoreductase [Frankia nepalensis]MBL7520991.1 LLM class flavin-dependent oxidoreductase [Frankia nepalensis]MBL7626145.1 LLM class flavin-dependent oxidoreductase [Frankia nepalensis]